MTHRPLLWGLAWILCAGTSAWGAETSPPSVGSIARDFALASLAGPTTRLSDLARTGPVLLIVLRGWPGYQCPICSVQVGAFVGRAQDIAVRGVRVVLVYPGPKERLGEYAREFVNDKQLPPGWRVLLDPDFSFIGSYGLRWNAPKETAYPSTFLIGRGRKVLFAKVSDTHGGRSSPQEVLAALPATPTRP